MIKRLFWVGVGLSLGVMIAVKVNQARESVQPTNLNRAVGRVSDRVSGFMGTLSSAMAEREEQLREELGLREPEERHTARVQYPASLRR